MTDGEREPGRLPGWAVTLIAGACTGYFLVRTGALGAGWAVLAGLGAVVFMALVLRAGK